MNNLIEFDGNAWVLAHMNTNLIWAADWDGLYRIFTTGNPPLALVLLAVNTIFLILFIVRKATARHRMRQSTAYAVQGLLIAANISMLFKDEIISHIHSVL
jgi:NADH:ubiquinone oxidoreductase subunit H